MKAPGLNGDPIIRRSGRRILPAKLKKSSCQKLGLGAPRGTGRVPGWNRQCRRGVYFGPLKTRLGLALLTTAFLSRQGRSRLLLNCVTYRKWIAHRVPRGALGCLRFSPESLAPPPPHQPIGRGRWAGGRWSPAHAPHPDQGPAKHPANIPRPLVQSAAPNGRRLPPAQTPRAHGAKQGQVIRGRKVVAVGTRWHGGM